MLRLIGRGATNTEIGQELYISEGTVETHVGRIFSTACGTGPRPSCLPSITASSARSRRRSSCRTRSRTLPRPDDADPTHPYRDGMLAALIRSKPAVTLSSVPPVTSSADVGGPKRVRRPRRFGLGRRRSDEKVEAIVLSGWFPGLRRAEVDLLARSAELVDVPAGDVVAIDADARRWWWMPLDGRLRATAADGSDFVLAPGRGCGVAGGWREEARVTITSVDETRLLVADRRHLLGAMDASAAVASAVERSVAWARDRPVGRGAPHLVAETAVSPSPA